MQTKKYYSNFIFLNKWAKTNNAILFRDLNYAEFEIKNCHIFES